LTADRSNIVLYALSTCSACKAVKRLLEEAQVDFTAVDVDLLGAEEKRAAMTALKEKNPRGSFPTLVAEDIVIVGNQSEKIRKVLDIPQPQKDHPLVQWWNRVRGKSQS